ncbi:non-ribosomal peptide synthetase [Clostridium sp. YIM B02505]|uniref:Non-ribosomal peptide synthetase n=1 Tax=Clostridium yunnanense TaxID=2800325 RepID=A0ABS1EPM9_9CLOT|nr:AMP-binding protein [Clostridium yunnanense]MBK1811310.1 non-ribosomal peptide synthetase [Clostridium yunnanense]
MNYVYEWIKREAERDGKKIAVKCENISLTYELLLNKIQNCAVFLGEQGVGKNEIVLLYMDNSIDAIVMIYSILSIGAVYMPINTEIPFKKVCNISNWESVKMVLLDSQTACYKEHFPKTTHVINIADTESVTNVQFPELSDSDSACCIMTSGSTGEPKGIILQYTGILNHLEYTRAILDVERGSTLCLSFNIGFVASIWQILLPISTGSMLILYKQSLIKSVYQFLKRVNEDKVLYVSLTPSFLNLYLDMIKYNNYKKVEFEALKAIILTGEALQPAVANKFYEEYSLQLINAYGMSECSNSILYYLVPCHSNHEVIYLGAPINNVKFEVETVCENESDSKASGEMCVSGICLAKECLELGQRKKRVFNEKGYFRTGDLVIKHENGIQYMGRNDNLVKVNGKRFQLEEVEKQLNQCPGIKRSAVIQIEMGSEKKALIGFFEADEKISIKSVMLELRRKLPIYMIPAKLLHVEKVPSNANGKLSRGYFKKHYSDFLGSEESRNRISDSSVHGRIVKIVEDIVGMPVAQEEVKAGLEDLGIRSLNFIEIVVLIQEEFSIKFDDDFFSMEKFSTLMDLEEYVETKIFIESE